jgi:hypothetical protein
MGASFAAGSIGFALAPLNTYAERAGSHRDAVTYFIGSILFTIGGLAQGVLAWPERGKARDGIWAWRTAWVQSVGTVMWAWRTAWVQSVGTVMFNVMTFAGLHTNVGASDYNTLVWLPNVLGSACFLVSAGFFYFSSPRRGVRLTHDHRGWWEPLVNGVGCVLFGVSAVAGFGVASTGRLLSADIADWTTTAGALCFLALGLTALRTGRSFKVPRLRRVRRLWQVAEREVVEVVEVVEGDL